MDRPHRSPSRTGTEVQERIRAARERHHAGPVALSALLRLPAGTIGAVVARLGLPRLFEIDRVTGAPGRARTRAENRYEHPAAGDLLHVDVKKLGRVPPGGGWRVHGRSAGTHHSGQGWDFVHVAVDDHSRAAHAEVHPDGRATTCAAFLARAVSWLADHDPTVTRVLTDNAKAYRTSSVWARTCDQLGIARRFTRPRCPWTNGKAERAHHR